MANNKQNTYSARWTGVKEPGKPWKPGGTIQNIKAESESDARQQAVANLMARGIKAIIGAITKK